MAFIIIIIISYYQFFLEACVGIPVNRLKNGDNISMYYLNEKPKKYCIYVSGEWQRSLTACTD